jgi:NAD(P)H-quinone oxidoreductase subunit 5
MTYLYLPLVGPVILLLAALYAARHPGKRPGRVPKLTELW